MTFVISKEFFSSKAKKYKNRVWKTVRVVNQIPHSNKEMIQFLKQTGGWGKYSVYYPQPRWKGFSSVFRVDILRSGTEIIFSRLEDQVKQREQEWIFKH